MPRRHPRRGLTSVTWYARRDKDAACLQQECRKIAANPLQECSKHVANMQRIRCISVLLGGFGWGHVGLLVGGWRGGAATVAPSPPPCNRRAGPRALGITPKRKRGSAPKIPKNPKFFPRPPRPPDGKPPITARRVFRRGPPGGHTVEALPIGKTTEILRKYGAIK